MAGHIEWEHGMTRQGTHKMAAAGQDAAGQDAAGQDAAGQDGPRQ